MTFKRNVIACVAFCIMAIFMIALCGCDDLGAYESTEEYYASFGEIVLLGGDAGNGKKYSVKDYFYNKESREDFLTGKDGKYNGITHSDYVYMAIPLNDDLNMDSLAMYLQSKNDVTLYINVYITNKIPTNWKKIEEADTSINGASNLSAEAFEYKTDKSLATPYANESEGEGYDDPDYKTRVGEVSLYLKGGKWNSFTLDSFKIEDTYEKSIQLEKNQYILLQIRNNSGVRDLDKETGLLVDPQTGLVLEKANITMTNLLVRAIDKAEAKEGKE